MATSTTSTTLKITIGYRDFLVDVTSLQQLEIFRNLRPVSYKHPRLPDGSYGDAVYYPNKHENGLQIEFFNGKFEDKEPKDAPPVEPIEAAA